MTKEEILHLSNLARIALTESEIESLQKEITDILSYVSIVTDIAADVPAKQLTPRYNVFREDEVTNDPGSMTEDILRQAPKRHGQYVEVKKILSNDE